MESTSCLRFVGGQGCWGRSRTEYSVGCLQGLRGEKDFDTCMWYGAQRWAKPLCLLLSQILYDFCDITKFDQLQVYRNFLKKGKSRTLWNHDIFIKWAPRSSALSFLWLSGNPTCLTIVHLSYTSKKHPSRSRLHPPMEWSSFGRREFNCWHLRTETSGWWSRSEKTWLGGVCFFGGDGAEGPVGKKSSSMATCGSLWTINHWFPLIRPY